MILNKIVKLLELLVALLCIVLLATLFIQVLNRYVFGVSWPVLQFIIPFCFIWLCMICIALAVHKSEHFEVDIFAKYLKGNANIIHGIVISILVLFGGIIIVFTSLGFLELGFLKKSPAIGIKMIYIYSAFFVGGVLIVLIAFDRIIHKYILVSKETDRYNVSEGS